MKIEKNQDGKIHKVWLNKNDFQDLRNAAQGYREDLILRLGGKVGLRSLEIPQIKPKHKKLASNGENYFLRVPKRKDTKIGEGKPRHSFLPKNIHRDLNIYINEHHIGKNQKIFPVSSSRIKQIIKNTAENTAKQTGNKNFKKVSIHDLRRYFRHKVACRRTNDPRNSNGNTKIRRQPNNKTISK